MCGICGLLHFDAERQADEGLVRRMASVMEHRGPDAEGVHVDGPAGLGHRRLSIIDLSGGQQPMCNEDGSVWIAFNGEIYNYQEIADQLKTKGHQFRTRSDTETIVHAYEEYGADCAEKLRGMFAFAIWDGRKRRLLLVRDRIGIKPLYYTIKNNTLYFASEIKSILQEPSIKREMNPAALDYYLSLRFCPGPQTMFKNIYKLPPGFMLTAEGSNLEVKKYWDLEFNAPGDGPSYKEWKDRFEQKASESIGIRLMSEGFYGLGRHKVQVPAN